MYASARSPFFKNARLAILHLPAAKHTCHVLEQSELSIHAFGQAHGQTLHQWQETWDALGVHVVPLQETNCLLAPLVAVQAAELFGLVLGQDP